LIRCAGRFNHSRALVASVAEAVRRKAGVGREGRDGVGCLRAGGEGGGVSRWRAGEGVGEVGIAAVQLWGRMGAWRELVDRAAGL
jgi:hypothetical protein